MDMFYNYVINIRIRRKKGQYFLLLNQKKRKPIFQIMRGNCWVGIHFLMLVAFRFQFSDKC